MADGTEVFDYLAVAGPEYDESAGVDVGHVSSWGMTNT
jgi:hypothetical protein